MKPLVLIILDGWGVRDEPKDNAIASAKKPAFAKLWSSSPHTTLQASGPAVGLPDGVIGNSEVGHMNIGAGRIVYTGLSQIYQAIEDKNFFSNPALLAAVEAVRKNRSRLHLMGLLSDGAVHSHQDHLYALLDLAGKEGMKEVFVHCLMDGRDTPPRDGMKYVAQLEGEMKKRGIGKIATVAGRYFAMDRDKRWDRVEKAYDILTGSSKSGERSAKEILEKSYKEGVGDEFVIPSAVLDPKGEPCGPVRDGDAVIFFNFRADRAREMTEALTAPSFSGFTRKKFSKLSAFVCMAPYDGRFPLPVAFAPTFPKRIFPEVISEKGMTQLRIAETEKYAHVTFFFNGGVDRVFPGEERMLVPSPREVATYDLKPEMNACGITEKVLMAIASRKFGFILLNFANADMVGHSAKPAPITRAVEVIDACLGKIVPAVMATGGEVVITADHGNAEQMVDERGEPLTAHTLNPVPFILVSRERRGIKLKPGRLCDVSPTLLELLGIPKPKEMTGTSLIESSPLP